MYPTCKTKIGVLVLMTCLHVVAYGQLSTHKAHCLFVYNFTKYIQWPDGAIKDDFVIGVFGKSDVRAELEKMSAMKKVNGKTIRVVEINSTDKLDGVHILFIPDEKSGQIGAVIESIKGKPVLLVTERQGLIQKGAGISFLTDDNNLKFEINSSSISSQNLRVASQLETLAHKGS